MKRKRFTEEQIIAVLREHEARMKTGDLARQHGISEATLYNWKAKFGGMDVPDAKRLRALEDENSKLKRLLADAMLDNSALKVGLSCVGFNSNQNGFYQFIGGPEACVPSVSPAESCDRTLSMTII